MNDPAWCRSRLDTLDDELRQLAFGEGRFAETLHEVRLTWADSAAQDVFARHLDPHRDVSAEVRERLLAQSTVLREVVGRMDEAEAPAAEVQQLSDDSARRRDEAAQDTDSAHQRADRSLEESSTAQQFTDDALRTLQSI